VIEILGKPNSETKKSLKFGKTGVVYLNNNLVINWTGFPKDCSKFDNESKKLYASAVKRTKEIIKKQNLKKQTRSLSFASSVEKHIREFAARKYPNNSRMQSYVYKEQLSAYNYLKTVNDNEIKNFAIRKYPNDFSMQKYTYDKQLAAKNYMKRVSNYDAKKQAVRKYPLDYSMQKYIYDRLAY
jgi:hypothetical protein